MTDRAMTEAFAEHVATLAVRRGLDRAALARNSGLSLERVDLVLDARRWPCPLDQQALARALGVSVGDLIPDPRNI